MEKPPTLPTIWVNPQALVALVNFLLDGRLEYFKNKNDKETLCFIARCIEDYIKSGRMYDVKVEPKPEKRKKVRGVPKGRVVRKMWLENLLRDGSDVPYTWVV